MNRAEFKIAVRMVEDKVKLSDVDISIFDGCAYPDFQPIYTTIEAAAKWISWQARMFNGEWDTFALDECATIACAKRRVLIV